MDKEYYRLAEQLQRAKKLPSGCPASEYSTRAIAYIVYTMPNLAATPDIEDAAEYLLDLMPATLRESARQEAESGERLPPVWPVKTSAPARTGYLRLLVALPTQPAHRALPAPLLALRPHSANHL